MIEEHSQELSMTQQTLVREQAGAWSLPRQESWLRTARRRVLSIPLFVVATIAVLMVSPVVYPAAWGVDVSLRQRKSVLRAFAMLQVFLLCETAGIAGTAWIWARHGRNRERFLEANFRLQCWWAGTLYRAGVRLFSLKVEVEGLAYAAEGPMLVFSRHVSPIDNLLPAVLVSVEHGLRLRWVINRSLLRDPCLDIVGNRLPNCFVANSSGDSEREIRRVEALGQGLGRRDGVLIFPEGTLFSAQRRERIIRKLQLSGEAKLLERAQRLQQLLPPRLGGSMALLGAAEGVDALFIAHTGLEDATRYHSILRGGLIGRTVRVRIWREAANTIPSEGNQRVEWLHDRWEEMDRWVTANRRVR
jgi:1-acyl-sn-glycerol-3-phosphate acyltransferase